MPSVIFCHWKIMISANTTLATGTTVATTPTATEKSIEATEQSVGVIVAVAFGSSMLTLVISVAICLVRRYTHQSFYIHLFPSDARRRRTWQRLMWTGTTTCTSPRRGRGWMKVFARLLIPMITMDNRVLLCTHWLVLTLWCEIKCWHQPFT